MNIGQGKKSKQPFKADVTIKQDVTGEKSYFNWFLYFTAIVVDIPLISNGCMAVWTSSVIPHLSSNDSNTNPIGRSITIAEESALASIPAITNILGLLLFMRVPDLIGRKNTLVVSSLGMLASLVTIAFARNIYLYIIALATFSLSRSASFVTTPTYNREISKKHNRGKLACFNAATVPIGNFYGFLVGPFTNIFVFTLLCALPQVIFLGLHVFIPESPMFFALKGDNTSAMQSLKKLGKNSNPAELENDYLNMQKDIEELSSTPKRGYTDLFRTRAARRALMICSAAIAGAELSGISSFLAFAAPLFDEAGTKLSGNTVGIIMGAVKIISYLVSMSVVDRIGRRCLMLTSTFMCGILLLLFGIYFYLKVNEPQVVEQLEWLPIVCILCYIMFYALGYGTVSYALMFELFPADLTTAGVTVCCIAMSVSMFFVTFTFPYITKYLGVYYAIWLFSFCSFSFFLFFWTKLFETKGKSLKEIQEILNEKHTS